MITNQIEFDARTFPIYVSLYVCQFHVNKYDRQSFPYVIATLEMRNKKEQKL